MQMEPFCNSDIDNGLQMREVLKLWIGCVIDNELSASHAKVDGFAYTVVAKPELCYVGGLAAAIGVPTNSALAISSVKGVDPVVTVWLVPY